MIREDLYPFVQRNPHLRAALCQMLHARLSAEVLREDVWGFAEEMADLRKAPCTVTELRVLVAAGCLDHAEEVTRPGDRGRSFRPEPRLTFGPRTCFVLTTAGAEAVAQWEDESDTGRVRPPGGTRRRVPRWSETARELRVDGRVLKRFRRPAPNLELVLAAFEEEGWPRHLDDPLPPEPGLDPHQRLHDTVRRLNACQVPHKIRFESDGLGAGITWTWAAKT